MDSRTLYDANLEPKKELRLPNKLPKEISDNKEMDRMSSREQNVQFIPSGLPPSTVTSLHQSNMLQQPSFSETATSQHPSPLVRNSIESHQHPETLQNTNVFRNDDTKIFTSKLSVDAKEFVPAASRVSPTPVMVSTSVQDRLKKHKVADTPSMPEANRQPYYDDAESFAGSMDECRLNHIIDTLIKDPGQFDDLLDIFMDTLLPYYEDIFVLSHVAHLLVNKSMDHPSFRYSAARLCCYIEQFCPKFRAALHLECSKKLKSNVSNAGLLLFVAELYAQLHPVNLYAQYLIDAYKNLLEIGGYDNIKSVCQALKLTGSSLDVSVKQGMDEVFKSLELVKVSSTGTALSLINSVIALRGAKWGRSSPTPSNDTNLEGENNYWGECSQRVFIKADGSHFSPEENEFLSANVNSSEEYLTDMSDPDELCDPEPEMDEEIQKAFKDFVRLSRP